MDVMKRKKPMKTLQELTLLDRFLFAEVMDRKENMQLLLEIIFAKDFELCHPPQSEKEFRRLPENRSIRVDVWVMDEDQRVYNTEVQKIDTHNLPKRSRLYQGYIDSKLLPPGVTDYNQLNDLFMIIISPFDIFGYDRYRYTFAYECLEVPGLALNDGAVRIFLNTRGTNDDETDPDLVELLHYMEFTNEHTRNASSDKLNTLKHNVQLVKHDEEVGVRYMQAWEEIEWAKLEAKAEARAEGRKEGLAEGREEGLAEGREEGLAAGREEGLAAGREEGRIKTLCQLVKDGLLPLEIAMQQAHISEEEFKQAIDTIE